MCLHSPKFNINTLHRVENILHGKEILRNWEKNIKNISYLVQNIIYRSVTDVPNNIYLHHELTTQATEDNHPVWQYLLEITVLIHCVHLLNHCYFVGTISVPHTTLIFSEGSCMFCFHVEWCQAMEACAVGVLLQRIRRKVECISFMLLGKIQKALKSIYLSVTQALKCSLQATSIKVSLLLLLGELSSAVTGWAQQTHFSWSEYYSSDADWPDDPRCSFQLCHVFH